MDVSSVITLLKENYSGLSQINTWGETSLFYNPDNLLKRGAYFLTFKQKDGENDKASMLNRDNVNYRMNFKISKASFLERFDEPALPKRPNKGGVITLVSGKPYNPIDIDCLFPHPVYAWMSWVSIVDPSEASLTQLIQSGLIDEAYEDAVQRYRKATSKILILPKSHRFNIK